MPVKGTISGSDVTYKSKNAATVDVTDTGVISAKKSGHVKVVANVDGKILRQMLRLLLKMLTGQQKKKLKFQRQRQDTVRREECLLIIMTAVQ